MSANINLFEKCFGHMTIADLVKNGILHTGSAFEVIEVMYFGGVRHDNLCEKGSDIIRKIRGRACKVEVKFITLKTRYYKSGKYLKAQRGATISRLDHKDGCILVVYIYDEDLDELTRFEYAPGAWEGFRIGAKKNCIRVSAPANVSLRDNDRLGCSFFDPSLFSVNPKDMATL